MFNLGWTEILLILGVALLIFGPGKLPEVGQTIGKTIREFKGAINNMDEDIKKEVNGLKEEVSEVKDALDVKGAMDDLKKDLADAVKVDLDTDKKAE